MQISTCTSADIELLKLITSFTQTESGSSELSFNLNKMRGVFDSGWLVESFWGMKWLLISWQILSPFLWCGGYGHRTTGDREISPVH